MLFGVRKHCDPIKGNQRIKFVFTESEEMFQFFDLRHVGKNFFFRSFRKSRLTDINCLQLLAVKKVRGCQGFPFLRQIDSLTGTALQNSLVRYVASLMMFPHLPTRPASLRKHVRAELSWRTTNRNLSLSPMPHFPFKSNNLTFCFFTRNGHLMDCMRHCCYLWQLRDVIALRLQIVRQETSIPSHWRKLNEIQPLPAICVLSKGWLDCLFRSVWMVISPTPVKAPRLWSNNGMVLRAE